MHSTNDPKTIAQFDELLDTNTFRVDVGDGRSDYTLEKYPASKPDSGGVTSYLLIDNDDKQVAEVFPDIEAAVLYLIFLGGNLDEMPQPEPPREVSISDVYRAIARQHFNYRGRCPVCGTTDPLNHNVQIHMGHEKSKPVCTHSWVTVGGQETFCTICFLMPE